MPFKSKAQQRWMFAAEARKELPEGTAREWAHHTPNIKKLPDRVGEKTKEGFDAMNTIAILAKQAADDHLVNKLANDTQITPELVRHLANSVNMSPNAFVKAAYDDPAGYTIFLKVASGAVKQAQLTKGAAASSLVQRLIGAMSKAKGGVQAAGSALNKGANKTLDAAGIKNQTARTASKVGAGATAVGGTGMAANSMMGGAPQKPQAGAPEQPGQHEATVNSQIGGAQAAGMAQGANPAAQAGAAPVQTNGPAPNPQQGGGLSQGAKGGLAAAGVGLGALGAGAMLRRRKRNQQQQKTAADIAKDVMRTAIVKKAADLMRKQAADKFVSAMDVVAQKLPIEKQAMVRKLQAAVAEGKPLSHAIKLAYPHLNGEQRGILATKLVKVACSLKQAADKPFFKGKVQGRQESSVKMKDGAVNRMKEMSKCGGDNLGKASGLEKLAMNPLLKALLSQTAGTLPKTMKGVGAKVSTTAGGMKPAAMGGMGGSTMGQAEQARLAAANAAKPPTPARSILDI